MTIESSFGGASLLEPIAGSAFTLNLVYIGLKRFRYRRKIRSVADEHLQNLTNNGDPLPEVDKQLDVYKQLVSLGSLPNHAVDEIKDPILNAKMPAEAWGLCYEIIYRKHRDRYISFVSATICAFVLVAGVADSINIWTGLDPVFSQYWISWWFYAVLLSGLAPVALAVCGGWIVDKTTEVAKKCSRELATAMAIGAQTAQIRPSSAIHPPTVVETQSLSAQIAVQSIPASSLTRTIPAAPLRRRPPDRPS